MKGTYLRRKWSFVTVSVKTYLNEGTESGITVALRKWKWRSVPSYGSKWWIYGCHYVLVVVVLRPLTGQRVGKECFNEPTRSMSSPYPLLSYRVFGRHVFDSLTSAHPLFLGLYHFLLKLVTLVRFMTTHFRIVTPYMLLVLTRPSCILTDRLDVCRRLRRVTQPWVLTSNTF